MSAMTWEQYRAANPNDPNAYQSWQLQMHPGETRAQWQARVQDLGWDERGDISWQALKRNAEDGHGMVEWFGKNWRDIKAMQEKGTWDAFLAEHRSPTAGSSSGSSGGGYSGGGYDDSGSTGGGTLGDPKVQYAMKSLDKYDRDAASAIINLFDTYGLSSMAPLVIDMIKRGMGEAAIVASLRETKEYKTRFPGMEALRQQGYNAISEAQYLQLEDSYHQALQSAGLPKGFYDDAKDFVGFISNGVDPSELKQRATAAVDLANQVDPAQRELLSSMYGVSTTDLAAYFLDPKRAMPILQKQLGTVQVANAAQKAGIQADFANRNRFERLVDNGIGAEQAAQGYSQIAFEMDPLKNLASIWGQGADKRWSLDDAENATFFGNADANKKKQRLAGQERAAFSGASGFDSRVSGRGNTAGSF